LFLKEQIKGIIIIQRHLNRTLAARVAQLAAA
jgi:hypothetical protein